jgi:hypothetical protein
LLQRSIAALLGRSERWVSDEIRTDPPHISIRAIIEFWEILNPPQRADVLLKLGLVRRLFHQSLH